MTSFNEIQLVFSDVSCT